MSNATIMPMAFEPESLLLALTLPRRQENAHMDGALAISDLNRVTNLTHSVLAKKMMLLYVIPQTQIRPSNDISYTEENTAC